MTSPAPFRVVPSAKNPKCFAVVYAECKSYFFAPDGRGWTCEEHAAAFAKRLNERWVKT